MGDIPGPWSLHSFEGFDEFENLKVSSLGLKGGGVLGGSGDLVTGYFKDL